MASCWIFLSKHHFPQCLNKTLVGIIFSASLCLPVNTQVQSQDEGKDTFYSQLNRAIIRLEHSTQDTTIADGTAFFVHTGNKLFVVTARHVAEKNYDMQARVPTKHDSTGQIEVVQLRLPRDRWVFHPQQGDSVTHYVDVAAMRLAGIKNREIRAFLYEPAASGESESNLLPLEDPVPPQAVLVFGFPLDIGFNLLEQRPFGRLGIVSMTAGQKFLRMKLNNNLKFVESRARIIDVEAFPGNSGSPIIIQLTPYNKKPQLLGLLVGTNIMLDFAIIEPVSRIRETLDIAKSQSIEGFECWFSIN